MNSELQSTDNSHFDVLTMGGHDRAELWKKTIESIEQYINGVENYNVLADLNAKDIRALISSIDFNQPLGPLEAIDFALKAFQRYQTHTAHPRYFGLFDPAPSTITIAAEILIAAVNPQLAAWSQSPFAVEVEQHLIRAFGQQFGYTMSELDGTFTSGGAEANHTAVVTALTKTFREFVGKGVRALPANPVLYISSEAHHSLIKAARACGLGNDAVHVIGVDDQLRMDLALLTSRIKSDRTNGLTPFMVVATAGTTNAGAIDPIESLADIAQREGLWLHTDAAWGGAFALVPEFRGLLNGIERSDSITFDPHKLLSVTRGTGMYLTRHRSVLTDAFQVVTPYMPKLTGEENVLDPFMHSLQWSRRFIGMKLFLSLLVTGWERYADVIRHHVNVARYLQTALEKNGWTVLNDPSLAVVCFVDSTHVTGQEESYLASIAQSVKASGRAWISTTRIKGTYPTLRACITNHRSRRSDIDVLISELNEARSKLRPK